MTEADLQIQVVEFLELAKNTCNFLYFSVPNEAMGKARGSGGLGRMARLRKMGMRSGVADLVIVKAGRAYFLELKAKKGRQSDNQRLFQADCFQVDANYGIAYSFGDALNLLNVWEIIP